MSEQPTQPPPPADRPLVEGMPVTVAVLQVDWSPKTGALAFNYARDPRLSIDDLATALERAAAAFRQGRFVADPFTVCGHDHGEGGV